MREIKFRAKRIDNEEWVYGVPLYYGDGVFISNGKLESNNGKDWRIKAIEVDPQTLGEFTGLPDKQSKGIFEGDIVKFYDNDLKKIRREKVFFEKGEFICFGCIFGERGLTETTVIGNIYEDKHLLEVSHA